MARPPTPVTGRKLIVVAAYIPYSLEVGESGELSVIDSSVALNYAKFLSQEGKFSDTVTVGVARVQDSNSVTVDTSDPELQGKVASALAPYQCTCIFLDKPGLLPNRFADSILLPLFHFASAIPSEHNNTMTADWELYKCLNERVSEEVLRIYRSGDVVSIHDHHLLLLPQLLRSAEPDLLMGFYLHTVFPSSEIYRVLPQREEILRGVSATNVLAFHNFIYARYFLSSCTRILGLECSASAILASSRVSK